MRIIAGAFRGRALAAPTSISTRPTSERMRQAIFDMLMHAPWAGRTAIEGAVVLDAFAGTGAMGLEALSRGAATAAFIERDRAALTALRANIAACKAAEICRVISRDVFSPPRASAGAGLIFLDPPYAEGAVVKAVDALANAGWLAAGALLVAECAQSETPVLASSPLVERVHGAAKVLVWRVG